MDKIKDYDVSFSGLSLGKHIFRFEISQEFFDLFDFDQDFQDPEVSVKLELEKRSTFLELKFDTEGSVIVDCDLTDEAYTQPIEGTMDMVVKFGHEFDDSDDEVWIIPEGEHEINVAQLIYEMILLSIPLKRVNPDSDSEKVQEALDLLDKYAPKESIEDNTSEDKSIDPRWDSLKELFKKK